MITSKDVKPYTQWRLQDKLVENCPRVRKGKSGLNTLAWDLDKVPFCDLPEDVDEIVFLGRVPFKAENYKGYKCQNVERDSAVKDTDASTYLFGFRREFEKLVSPKKMVTREMVRNLEEGGICKITVETGSKPIQVELEDKGFPSGFPKEEHLKASGKAKALRNLLKDVLPSADLVLQPGCCAGCWPRAGPFRTDRDREAHLLSKAHGRFSKDLSDWKRVLEKMLTMREKQQQLDEEATAGDNSPEKKKRKLTN